MTQPVVHSRPLTHLLVLFLFHMHEFLSEPHGLPLTETNTATLGAYFTLPSPTRNQIFDICQQATCEIPGMVSLGCFACQDSMNRDTVPRLQHQVAYLLFGSSFACSYAILTLALSSSP